MGGMDFGVKNYSAYEIGAYLGFFTAFLLFASIFYFAMNYFNNMPLNFRYYYVVTLVVVVFLTGLVIVKIKQR